MMLQDRAQARRLIERARQDPVWWARHVLGVRPWARQEDILRSVRDYPKTAVRSCHGIGKSFTAAATILWFLFCHPRAVVLSTAPTWRQVEKLIWREIRTAYHAARVPLGGKLMRKAPELYVADDWFAIGVSTRHPDRFQGFHAEHILVVVDEAAGVPEAIFEAVDGVLTSAHSRLLLLGNPTSVSGTFYDAFRKPGWRTISVSAFDTPNFTEFGITEDDVASGAWEEKIGGRPLPNPRLITPGWVADKYVQWGRHSPAYQSRVLGQFPEQGADTLIPLAWIEAAMERWSETPEGEPLVLGVDVARFGDDRTVLAPRKGAKVLPLMVYRHQDTMETAGAALVKAREMGGASIHVDVIGVGAGVVDRLHELDADVTGVNVAEAASDPEHFANRRSELWWGLRERLKPDAPDPIALPPDDELLAELAGIKYKITSRGQIAVESKEDMKRRLGYSPDKADAVVLAFATPVRGHGTVWMAYLESVLAERQDDRR